MAQTLNGHPQPIQPMVQNAMFYPNTYLNFNQNGEYTKHYYNGMERIASRLGDNNTTIAIDNMLENRKLSLEEQVRNEIQELISETPQVDMPPMLDILNLQPTGTPNDIYYYHPNHLGSTSFVTDQNQTITQGFLYAPFGEITTEYNVNFGNNTIPKYSFNAKELDEETGFYYYEARYYNPPTFISRDPLMSEKPWLTPYHYCSNNPIGRVDPSGMSDDWYQNADGTAAFWKEGNAQTVESNGETFHNIGETFSYTQENVTYNYNQNDLVSMTTNVLNESDYVSQYSKSDWDGTAASKACNKACNAMLENVGVYSNSMDVIVNEKGNGRAGVANANAASAINRMNVNLDLGLPTKINVDYRNGSCSADKMGDHFIVVMGKTEYLNNSGQVTSTSYRYYDPGTHYITKGTASSNILNVIDERLVGTHINNGQSIIATSIRQTAR